MSLRLGGSAAILGGVLFLSGLAVGQLKVFGEAFPAAVVILAGTAALLIALVGLSSFPGPAASAAHLGRSPCQRSERPCHASAWWG